MKMFRDFIDVDYDHFIGVDADSHRNVPEEVDNSDIWTDEDELKDLEVEHIRDSLDELERDPCAKCKLIHNVDASCEDCPYFQ